MNLKLPEIAHLWTHKAEGGLLIEGRQNRGGAQTMDISTYTRSYKVYNWRTRIIQPDELPNIPDIVEYSYDVELTTNIDFNWLYDITRWECIGIWRCSYQQGLRHNALAGAFEKTEIWPAIRALYVQEREHIIDLITNVFRVSQTGNGDLATWARYVHDHRETSSPFKDEKGKSIHWSAIDKNPKLVAQAWAEVESKVRQFIPYWEKMVKTPQNLLVRAEHSYAGVRARPANVTEIKKSEKTAILHCAKWQDRTVGGIPIESQLLWKIWHNEKLKVAAYEPIIRWAGKLLGCEVLYAGLHGIDAYLKVAMKAAFAADIKTAEKQIGILMTDLGFAMDMSHPAFPAEHGPKMYSGVGVTPILNLIFIVLYLVVAYDLLNIPKPNFVAIGGDNVASDGQLPVSLHLESSPRWLGWLIDRKCFGPPSLVTDNITHRQPFDPGRLPWQQYQGIQYIMRPLTAVVANAIAYQDSATRLLQYCKEKQIVDGEVINSGSVIDALWTPQKNEFTESFRSAFAKEEDWVTNSFRVQKLNPLDNQMRTYA